MPSPKRSPTSCMPFISGPSMIAPGASNCVRASCRSASRNSSSPVRSASANLWSRGIVVRSTCGLAASAGAASFSARSCCAFSMRRSAALSWRQRITSSITSNRSAGMSWYITFEAGLTMPMSMPFCIPWYRNTACMASRRKLLPRKANDRLLTPPLTWAWGRFCVIQPVARMKSSP